MNPLNFLTIFVTLHILFTWSAALYKGIHARKHLQDEIHRPKGIWPFVSVLVPAWNEKDTLPECIKALLLVEYPNWEIIVIAGGTDGTYDIAKSLRGENKHIIVIEQDPLGKNAALNKGMHFALGEVIILLDADCIVSPTWMKELVQPLNNQIVASSGNFSPIRTSPISLCEQMERISAYEINHSTHLNGASIAIYRSVIEQIGGFPEEIKVGVDWDLYVRIKKLKKESIYCSNALLRTIRPTTLKEFWGNEIRWRRAHFLSLFRFRNHFLHDFLSILRNLYFYMLSWFFMIFTTITICSIFFKTPESNHLILFLWILFILWTLGRRASLAIEITSFTKKKIWMELFWVPPLLLVITWVAICVATVTYFIQPMNFQGPRNKNGKTYAN
jgi:cellulose synthase/poly-beta-1,6-N-acetylglucosamine synthase-like glycosyltransferase